MGGCSISLLFGSLGEKWESMVAGSSTTMGSLPHQPNPLTLGGNQVHFCPNLLE